MPKLIRFAPAPDPSITAFPEKPSAAWRRELARCRNYTDALELSYRIIRETERAEKAAVKFGAQNSDQMAFPWSVAD